MIFSMVDGQCRLMAWIGNLVGCKNLKHIISNNNKTEYKTRLKMLLTKPEERRLDSDFFTCTSGNAWAGWRAGGVAGWSQLKRSSN